MDALSFDTKFEVALLLPGHGLSLLCRTCAEWRRAVAENPDLWARLVRPGRAPDNLCLPVGDGGSRRVYAAAYATARFVVRTLRSEMTDHFVAINDAVLALPCASESPCVQRVFKAWNRLQFHITGIPLCSRFDAAKLLRSTLSQIGTLRVVLDIVSSDEVLLAMVCSKRCGGNPVAFDSRLWELRRIARRLKYLYTLALRAHRATSEV